MKFRLVKLYNNGKEIIGDKEIIPVEVYTQPSFKGAFAVSEAGQTYSLSHADIYLIDAIGVRVTGIEVINKIYYYQEWLLLPPDRDY